MPTEITVRGTFSAFQPPERGTVRATISYEGPEMEPVYRQVAEDLETVKSTVVVLSKAKSVTWWSAGQLRTWSERPWNDKGDIRPLVHYARVDMEVKFADFAALSRWAGEHVAQTEGFSMGGVTWALTEHRRDELFAQVRMRAVRDAVSRAQLYADALGLGKVTATAIADAGMLSAQLGPEDESGGGAYLRAKASHANVELAPEDIEVSAKVDARFVAYPRA